MFLVLVENISARSGVPCLRNGGRFYRFFPENQILRTRRISQEYLCA